MTRVPMLSVLLMTAATTACQHGSAPSVPPAAPPVHARAEAAAFAAAIARTRAAFAADGGQLWGTSLVAVPFLGVDGERLYASEDPHVVGFVRDDAGLWEGALPADLEVAQTASAWAGRTWAMIELPVDEESPDPVRLLAHEAFHVVEPRVLGATADQRAGAGAELLDDAGGRTWFRLELRALIAALDAPAGSSEQRAAARDVVRFRTELDSLATPEERARERTLDRWEGLAEYTGVKLAAATTAQIQARVREYERSDSSFVRSAGYARGPAYGCLLDALSPGWRAPQTRDRAFSEALAAALGSAADRPADASRYDAGSVRAGETARSARHAKTKADLTARFVDGPVIVVALPEAHLTFDPNGQVPLGTAGVVMRGVGWKGANGAELSAPEGALVSPRWNELRVPRGDVTLPEGRLASAVDLHGPGWHLHLPAGWTAKTAASVTLLQSP